MTATKSRRFFSLFFFVAGGDNDGIWSYLTQLLLLTKLCELVNKVGCVRWIWRVCKEHPCVCAVNMLCKTLSKIITMSTNIIAKYQPTNMNKVFQWVPGYMIFACLSAKKFTKNKIIDLRDSSQTFVRGGAWCKKYLSRKFFRPPPSDRKKKKHFRAPFLPWKLRVNPIENHVNSIFNGKSVVIFFRAPLTRVKNCKGPLFASGPPLQVFVNISHD